MFQDKPKFRNVAKVQTYVALKSKYLPQTKSSYMFMCYLLKPNELNGGVAPEQTFWSMTENLVKTKFGSDCGMWTKWDL